MKVAAAQYPVDFLESWDAFAVKLERWVAEAATNGADLLLFPEYASIELTSLFGAEVYSSLPRQLAELQTILPDYLALFAELARRTGTHVCAGSYPVRHADGRYTNRSYFFWPDGRHDWQEKLQMTRFERERWHVSPGNELKVFDTDLGRLAINVCYDSEFPLLARRQVERGANLVLVPSCTDTDAGYNRVRIGCQARALENQCYVVQAPTVGDCDWSEAVDRNVGAAAIYTPVDYGFPADGVLAQGVMNTAMWVYADVDPAAIARVRDTGQVFNYRDWEGQYGPLGS
ncbi:MAG: carbon-nitrogen hydrolase family protein [Gammaproteobacteria bacterium]|nr:carbon-nitrogen hydrolase family protein [Gammaproteobacteria bacterium]MBI5616553.1 carbon-nitrogen hydrolase family protein [Gammaproteobacteria bacterium]